MKNNIKIKEIAFTIFPVSDFKKSKEFYEGVLGLVPSVEYISEKSGWIEYTIGEGTLAIGKSDEWPPIKNSTGVALEMEDYDAAIASLKEAEIPFFKEPQVFPSCSMAMITDPDGNNILIHKRKEK